MAATRLPSYPLDVLGDHELARRVVEVLVELVVVPRVLELLVELVVVVRVVELLERRAGFSAMIRCFDLLGICLAMDFETKSGELSRLKFKRNSSSRRSCLLTTLKII